jgi:hypothetical protein
MIKNSLELNQKGDEELYKAIVENMKENVKRLKEEIEIVKNKEKSDQRKFMRQRAFSEPKFDTIDNGLNGEIKWRREMKGKYLVFKNELKELKRRVNVDNCGVKDDGMGGRVKCVFKDVKTQVHLMNTGRRNIRLDQQIENNLDEFKEQAKDCNYTNYLKTRIKEIRHQNSTLKSQITKEVETPELDSLFTHKAEIKTLLIRKGAKLSTLNFAINEKQSEIDKFKLKAQRNIIDILDVLSYQKEEDKKRLVGIKEPINVNLYSSCSSSDDFLHNITPSKLYSPSEKFHKKVLQVPKVSIPIEELGFTFYQPPHESIMSKTVKNLTSRSSKCKNELTYNPDDLGDLTKNVRTYMIPLPGGGQFENDFTLPPSMIGESILASSRSNGGVYRLKDFKGDSGNIKGTLSRYRSPRFIEKENNQFISEVPKYDKFISKRSESRAKSKNEMMFRRHKSSTTSFKYAVEKKIKAKNKVMNTIKGTMTGHVVHSSKTSLNGNSNPVSHAHVGSIASIGNDLRNKMDKRNGVCRTPISESFMDLESMKISSNLNKIYVCHVSNAPSQSFHSISSTSVPVSSQNTSHRRSKPLISINKTKSIKNKLSRNY